MGEAGRDVPPMAPGIAARVARLRVPLGFLFGALVLWLATPTARTLALGGAVGCLGEALRIWAAGHLNKAREVTTSGPYRWMAHPLYVGSSVMGAGLAVAAGSFVVVGLVAVYLLVTFAAAIRSEEADLRRRFGDRYDCYRGARFRGGADGGTGGRRFSVARARANREPRAVAGLAIGLLVLALKAAYNGTFWQPGG